MSWRLGDSIRRRGGAPRTWRPRWRAGGAARWLGIALAIGLAAFGAGYGIAAMVLFPPPPETGAGVPTPSLAGRPLEEAERELRERGLVVGDVVELPHPERPLGVVVAQSPLAGQYLHPGARVSLGVSAGPPRARVPDVTGLPAERAAALAGMRGFEVSQRVDESSAPAGTVIGMEPVPGTELEVPAPLLLVVSSGPPALPQDTLAPDLPVPDTSAAGATPPDTLERSAPQAVPPPR